MKKNRRYVFPVMSGFLILILFPLSAQAAQGDDLEGKNIVELRVIGNRTINAQTIITNIESRKGAPYSQNTVQRDIKSLHRLGYFSKISTDAEPAPDGVKLTFLVKERPVLRGIEIKGNDLFKTKKLKDVLGLKEGDILDIYTVKKGIGEIQEMYRKKGYLRTEISFDELMDETAQYATLDITIDEGTRVDIVGIQFEGNEAIPTRRLLGVMKTKKKGLIGPVNAVFGWGTYKDEVFQEDIVRIKDYYYSQGYIDMDVVDVDFEYSPNNDLLVITIVVEEGDQYHVGDVRVEGNTIFPAGDVMGQVKLQPDAVYTPQGLAADENAIRRLYHKHGYIDSSVQGQVVLNETTGKLNVVFTVEERDLYFVDKVNITGNVKTKDMVIRRELNISPGDVFNIARVQTSQQRLLNTGFFETVSIDTKDTSVPNRKDLVIDVKEKRTGTLSLGAGFSSIDSLVGFVELTQSNFDLFNFPTFTGAGQKFRVRAEMGFEKQNVIISFTEPYLFNRRLSVGTDLFWRNSQYLSDDYDESRLGGDVRVAKAFGDFFRGETKVTLQRVKIDVDSSASSELLKEDGTFHVASIDFTATKDTRDKIIFPTRGAKTAAMIGFTGGDASVVKFEIKRSQYFRIFTKGFPHAISSWLPDHMQRDHIVKLYGEFGLATGGDVPIFERFFLGGGNSIRGFKYREVGPQDVNDEPLGGELKYAVTAEYTFPVYKTLRGAAFVDAGNVFKTPTDSTGVVVAIGGGIRWALPFGPIQLDLGFPIVTDKYTDDEDGAEFSFNLGTAY